MSKWVTVFMAVILSLSLVSGAYAATSAADFYKNKTLVIIVPTKPGGGTDYGARVIARFWPEFTGGSVVIKNVVGGQGLVGSNRVWHSKPNGLTIGIATTGAHVTGHVLNKSPGVAFDVTKFGWIGAHQPTPQALAVSAKKPFTSFNDLKQQQGLKQCSESPGNIGALYGALILDHIGAKDAQIVTGFGGSNELGLALGRGEVDYFIWSCTVVKLHMDKGWVKPPFLAMERKRSAFFPDVPTIFEVMKFSPEVEKEFDALERMGSDKSVFAPPGVPKDRLEFLRTTYDKIMSNEKALAQLQKRWEIWTGHYSGEKVAANMMQLEETGRIVERAKKLVEKYAGLKK